MKQVLKDSALKTVRFRAKVSRMGDKIHIIIPKSYHKDIEKGKLVDQFVDVEVTLDDEK